MRKVALSILAHPDDAEILCAGTLVRLSQARWDIHIATMTAGDCGTTTHSPQAISAIRTEEAKKAAALIGATYHCLAELDGLVVYDKPTILKIADFFRRIAPTLVFAHPREDYMLDHEQAHLLARSASFLYAAPNISRLPIIEGSGIPHLYYCDPIGGVSPLGVPIKPTTIIDISKQQDTKLAMLATHASQREWLRAHHGMDEYIEATKRHDADRGKLINSSAAEAFVQHRGHAYPENDILAELFK